MEALTEISGVISTLPMLKTTTQCFPALKLLLQSQEQSPTTLKKLAELHEKMGFNKESIGYYKKIIERLGDDDPKLLIKIAENYLKVNDLENAICSLSLVKYTDQLNESDKFFYVDTYIKGAEVSLEKKDFEMAKMIFPIVYKIIIFESKKLTQDKEDDESFPDVLILDDCWEENVCRWIKPIKSTLESIEKLHVAVNHMDCLPGNCTIEYLKKQC